MAATVGTIPALSEYQPGALPIATTVNVEIVDTTNATAAASFRMSQIDLVGKAPFVMDPAIPASGDMIAFFQIGNMLPKRTTFGNIGVPFGNLPTGGATGTLLIKQSGTDYDAGWVTLASHVAAGTAVTVSGSTTIAIGVTNFGIGSTQIATNAVGNVQFRQGTGLSVVGVAAAATANVADIVASGGTMVLQTNAAGTGLVWGVVGLGMLPTGSVGQVLMASGTGLAPAYSQITLSNASTVSGVLGVANGGLALSAYSAGDLIYASTTAVLSRLAAGTTGQFLRSSGTTAPTWATPPVSALVLLNTLTPNGVASTTDTTSLTATYTNYMIDFSNLRPSAASATFRMAMSTGAAFTGLVSSAINIAIGTTITHEGETSSTSLLLTGALATSAVSSTIGVSLNGNLVLYNPSNATDYKAITGSTMYGTSGATSSIANAQIAAFGTVTNAVTGLAFQFNTGTITTGIIKIYGMT